MTYTQIALDIDGPIATITLDRPEKLNAFTGVMMTEIIAAFDETDANDQVKAVIVTGRGRAFCAGADLSAGAATFDYEKLGGARSANPMREDGSIDWTHPATRDGGGQMTMRIFRSLKPVIAAVNGPAVGIGVTMQLAMDMRLASDTARFGFVFARRGIVPEAGSSWFLSKLVGLPQALEWCMTGRVFDAAEALKGGLVRSTHAPDDLLPAARALALEIAENTAPVSIALTRQMLWRMAGAASPWDAHRLDSKMVYMRGRSGDAKEGVVSFLEKRPPAYPDTVSQNMPENVFPWWDEEKW
ncbi:crotonase/enoyl-CoA hydratase family protein [Sandarakinorhabdus sp.]|jgi:enoyl-CoA hydratase/carnithine racemase|uniref:crotonase/enoyl-CoA hydratase family protein n=1 Tax=Sandarakinorhabdus sp. TaxID=1916663 RepID=UPI0028ADDAB9|nr:crotonase/enoyl-CoA hydratase family protein [Sandarakinorhabdus sp.]